MGLPERKPDYQARSPRKPGPGAPINPADWSFDRRMLARCLKRLELNLELAHERAYSDDHVKALKITAASIEGCLGMLQALEQHELIG